MINSKGRCIMNCFLLFTTTAATFWTFATLIQAQLSLPQDNRCYLENGASSESLFVTESALVGAVVGQVRVHGDPRPGGTIALRLQESDSPVAIAPGSKNITLRRRLDKEGIDGPSSVYVNLLCERLHTLDPVFVVPINIRVTDANDNAPTFVNAPYVLNVSEVTVVGTRVLQGVHATDADQLGPYSSVRYAVIPGLHSDYFQFENELEGTLVLRKPLDFESLRSFDVHIRAQDHGEPPRSTDTVLTVHVVDADDQNPRFLDDRYKAIFPQPATRGSSLTVKPRQIKAFDQDLGINASVYYTFNGLGPEYTIFKIHRNVGHVLLARDLTYADTQIPITLVIRATQQDNLDRYALATLTVSAALQSSTNNDVNLTSSTYTITSVGSNATLSVPQLERQPIRFSKQIFKIPADESLAPGAILATLQHNRPISEQLRYFVSDQNLLPIFSINGNGELGLKKQLDYVKRREYIFKVFATDGVTNDSAVINVTVLPAQINGRQGNEWEPRFRFPHYEFYIHGDDGELVGRIEAADGDTGDVVTLTLSGTNASLFNLSSKTGELRFVGGSGMADMQEEVVRLEITATDSGVPPKRRAVPVLVHFPLKSNSAGSLAKGSEGGTVILAGLGGLLLVLACIIAVLVTYICRGTNTSDDHLPYPLQPEKSQSTSPPMLEKSNPMFASSANNARVGIIGHSSQQQQQQQLATIRSPTATAMGGIPSDFCSEVRNTAAVLASSRLPSPKVHPAPPPPTIWSISPMGAENVDGKAKKLSWEDDKTDSDSTTENLNNIDTSPKIIENTNLTVYF